MKQYTITGNDADQRLDKFLKKLLPSASLGYIYKLIRKGNIKVISVSQLSTSFQLQNSRSTPFFTCLNSLPLQGKEAAKIKGKKQAKDYKLQEGEQVQIFLSDGDIDDLRQVENAGMRSIEIEQKLSQKDIIFEDEYLLVVNKNPGLNVHPGDHKTTEVSLIEQVHDYFAGKQDSLTFKPSLAHRIDRDTSGIIMIAKQKQMLMNLVDDFKTPSLNSLPQGEMKPQKKIKKTYFCLVLGKMSRKSGTITKKLLRIENARNENKVQVSDTGLEAITHYTVLDEYRLKIPEGEQIISALEVQIETGRMHQIRVHMSALGNPILGDKNYGNKKLNSYFAKHLGITRHMLHAWKIGFYHSQIAKKMNLEAAFKKDMMEFITKLER